MAVQTLNAQPVVPSIALARNATFVQARNEFGGRMLNITEIHKFAKEHPGEFASIMREMNLNSKTLAVISEEPLGSFMQNGKLIVSSTYGDETRQLEIPEISLKTAKIDLNKKNPYLLIHDGHITKQGGKNNKEFDVTIDPAYLESLGQFLRLLTNPGSDGWYKEIEGVAAGKPSSVDDTGALYHWKGSQFGPVQRGSVYSYGDVRRDVYVGVGFDVRRGVLVHETGAQAPAAKNGADIRTLAEGATNAVDSAVTEFGARANEILQPVRDFIAKVQSQ